MRASILERFNSKYSPEPNSGCWLWTDSTNSKGYGYIKVGVKRRFAHRVSYELFVGLIPEGLQVCHKCDTPCCVNPRHLWTGTSQENNDDCFRKERRTRTLRAADARAIKASSGSLKEVASQFKVTIGMVSMIRNGRRWKTA